MNMHELRASTSIRHTNSWPKRRYTVNSALVYGMGNSRTGRWYVYICTYPRSHCTCVALLHYVLYKVTKSHKVRAWRAFARWNIPTGTAPNGRRCAPTVRMHGAFSVSRVFFSPRAFFERSIFPSFQTYTPHGHGVKSCVHAFFPTSQLEFNFSFVSRFLPTVRYCRFLQHPTCLNFIPPLWLCFFRLFFFFFFLF